MYQLATGSFLRRVTTGRSNLVNHVNFIWNIAESLRGPFKPAEYGSVVLPFTVLA